MPEPNTQQLKSDLRKRLRRILGNVAPEQWQRGAELACQRLLDVIALRRAKGVLFFMPTAKELDVGLAAADCLKQGVVVCLPRANWNVSMGASDEAAITPAQVSRWDRGELVETKFGIFEPRADAPAIDLARLDLVVVPGLAFDEKGGRLGKGGGFYDRFLSQPGLGAAKIGVGLDEQMVAELPMDSWDVPLDGLVTPTRTLVFGGGKG